MLGKIAFRNVRRQTGNYLIYYLTVSITIALIFAFNNMVFSQQLWNHPAAIPQMQAGLLSISLMIALVEAFVLGYASAFLLKLRKREFGMYLTLGMNRRQILLIFFGEEFFMCAAALITGIGAGIILFQGLMELLSRLMDMELSFSLLSIRGLLVTAGLVTGMFFLSAAACSLYLRRVTIYRLLHSHRQVEKGERHPKAWFLAALAAAVSIVVSCIWFSGALERLAHSSDTPPGDIFGSLLLGVAGVLLFYIGLGRCAAGMLLKSSGFCCRGTNTFVLRQLSGKLRSNSLMQGILALLLLFSLIGTDITFAQSVSYEAMLERSFPFAVSGYLEEGKEHPVDFDQAERILESYTEITSQISWSFYLGGSSQLCQASRWEGIQGQDVLIGESQLNQVLESLGEEPVHLDGTYRIYSSSPQIQGYDFPSVSPVWSGEQYPFGGFLEDMVQIVPGDVYCLAVVPDQALEDLQTAFSCRGYQLKNEDFDAAALLEDLKNPLTAADTGYSLSSDFQVREYNRLQGLQSLAVLIVSALYMGIIFALLALAVLALKTLSGLAEDRVRYRILFQIGAGEEEQAKALRRQMGIFFFLPLAMPLLLCVPVTALCIRFVELIGFGRQSGRVAAAGAAVIGVLTAAYVLYFFIAYLTAKRQVITRK